MPSRRQSSACIIWTDHYELTTEGREGQRMRKIPAAAEGPTGVCSWPPQWSSQQHHDLMAVYYFMLILLSHLSLPTLTVCISLNYEPMIVYQHWEWSARHHTCTACGDARHTFRSEWWNSPHPHPRAENSFSLEPNWTCIASTPPVDAPASCHQQRNAPRRQYILHQCNPPALNCQKCCTS